MQMNILYNNDYPPRSTVLFGILNSLSTGLNNTVLLMILRPLLINKLEINNNPAVRQYKCLKWGTNLTFFTYIINRYRSINEANETERPSN